MCNSDKITTVHPINVNDNQPRHRGQTGPGRLIVIVLTLILMTAGCQSPPVTPSASQAVAVVVASATSTPPPPTLTATPPPSPTPTISPTATTRPTATPSPTPVPVCTAPELPGSGRWCYTTTTGDLFIHPLTADSDAGIAYLIDGGRVLALPLTEPAPPQILLAPGDTVEGGRVLEPLDLAVVPQGLVVLDRAGDVYLYTADDGRWTVERPDRGIDDASSHYYLSLAAAGNSRYLLETSYNYGLRYRPEPGEFEEFGWSIGAAYFVDLAVERNDEVSTAYVLTRPLDGGQGELTRYVQGEIDRRFKSRQEISQPRALLLTGEQLYLLDQAGRRLTTLQANSGLIESEWQLPFEVSALGAAGEQIFLAGRNALYFLERPELTALIPTTGQIPPLSFPQPHDPEVLQLLPPLIRPIENLAVADRDLRLPGAPRHYRFGIHEGADFYWGPGREVRATAAGTVIRVTTDYIIPGPEQFAAWRAQARELGYSSPEALDFFRGRQIWIEHAPGIISRYVHLSAIDPAVQEGAAITQGQIIGQVGNSGSPGSLEGEAVDAHLHYELWFGEHYLGQFLRPIETRELFETIFTD